jgi:hypothetical protein
VRAWEQEKNEVFKNAMYYFSTHHKKGSSKVSPNVTIK